MEFILNKEILLEILQQIVGPTTTKQNFPILNSVIIQTIKNKIKFTTTDLDVTIIVFQDGEVTEEGKTAIPMKRFLSIIRELPSHEISVKAIKNNLLIKCEKIEFKLPLIPPTEFPPIEEKKKATLIKLDPVVLEEMIRLTSFCVGYEDVSYVLNGILFELQEDEIALVSTDGKRLSFIRRKLPESQPEIKTKISFILPIKAIQELYKIIKTVENEMFLFIEENKIGFDFKNTQIIIRPIEGEFPNYSQYIPRENKDKMIVNRQKFLFSLRRADILSTQEYQGVKIELKKDKATLLKTTPQLGEVKEVVDVQYQGAALEIGFNAQYLIDVLKNIDDEDVVFEFTAPDKPAVLRKENYVYLVLPVKI